MSLSSDEIARLLPGFLLCSQNYSVVVTDLEGKYLFVNEVFKNRFSFLATDFIGLPFQSTVYEEDIEKCNEAAYYCITHPEETVSLLIRKPENEPHEFYWTNWEFSLLTDQNEQPTGILCIGHDVTLEKGAKERLKYSEGKFKAILDSAMSGNMLISPDLQILSANKKIKEYAKKLTDKDMEEGKNVEQYLLKGTEESFYGNFQRALAGERVELEQNFVFPNEGEKWFSISYFPVYDIYDKIIGVAFNIIDISELKKAEEEIKKMRNMLTAIYSSSIDAEILISPDYKILYFNKIAAELIKGLFGKYSQIGESYLDYILPHLHKKVKSELDRALSGEVVRSEQTDGKKWYQFTNFPVYDEDNQLVGIAINARDISELKKIQLTLKESEQRLAILASNFPDGFISLIDKDLKFLYTGGRGYKNRMVNTLELIGKPIQKILPVDIHTKIRELLPSLLVGNHHSFEAVFHEQTFLNTLQPIFNEEGQVESFVLASIDITERKKNEEKIKERNIILEEIAWLQSHEVRRPVANILGLMQLIKMEERAADEKISLYLEHLEKATENLDQIIHKIVAKANVIF